MSLFFFNKDLYVPVVLLPINKNFISYNKSFDDNHGQIQAVLQYNFLACIQDKEYILKQYLDDCHIQRKYTVICDLETSPHELLFILSEAVPSFLDIIQIKTLLKPMENQRLLFLKMTIFSCYTSMTFLPCYALLVQEKCSHCGQVSHSASEK